MFKTKDSCVQPYCKHPTTKTGEFRGVLCATHVKTIKSAPQDWMTVIDGLSRNKKKIHAYATSLIAFFDHLPAPAVEEEDWAAIARRQLDELAVVPEKKKRRSKFYPCRALGCKSAGKVGNGEFLCNAHRDFRDRKGRAGKKGLAKHNADYAKAHPKDERVVTMLRAV